MSEFAVIADIVIRIPISWRDVAFFAGGVLLLPALFLLAVMIDFMVHG